MPTPEEARAELARRRGAQGQPPAPTAQQITPEQARAELARRRQQPAAQPSGDDNLLHQYGTGVAEGTAGTVAAVGDAPGLLEGATGWVAERLGMDGERARAGVRGLTTLAGSLYSPVSPVDSSITPHPTSEQLNRAIQSIPGVEYAPAPQTLEGSVARTTGQFTPGAVFPGSVAARAARVVVPAATSETAGQVARQVAPEHETAARVIGGIGGGLAAEGVIAAGARGRTQAQQRWQDETAARALEDEWMPMTAGERAGDTAAMTRENSLRRGGPAQAQGSLREFDEQRAGALSGNLERVATRGHEPLADTIGDAGVIVADDLRSGFETMRGEQGVRYARAHDLAGNQPIAPTDELGANVARIVDENFLDDGPSVAILNRLNAQIRSGQATYANAERARQALNVRLGDAMRSGTNAEVVTVHRLIDELDAFVEPRLSGDAQVAIREARGFTREMMNMYGDQARPDLSTGHVGRRDPGGRVIQDVLETNMTGEQVIDAIFGAGGRPPRAALGAVQRIHDRATGRIVSGGYEAPTGGAGRQQRAPGRESLVGGRGTVGGRQFQGPSEAQQRQWNLPANEAISDPALQALREAFILRLRRGIAARGEGDPIPTRQLANDLRAALEGPGAEITPLLFNGEEIALLQRARLAMEQASPPRGSYMPSAPGIAQDAAERSLAAISGRILGWVPVVGPPIERAIQEGVVNARAIRDARNAVAPPQQPPMGPVTQPNASAPIIQGYLGASANEDEEPYTPAYMRRR